jgi:hypothetical protein
MSDGKERAMYLWHLALADRIAAHSVYGGIPVTTEVPKLRTPANSFKQALQALTQALIGQAGKSGLGVFVKFPHTQGASTKSTSLTTMMVCEISVLESIMHNSRASGFAPAGVGLHNDDAAIGIARILENFQVYGIAGQARCQEVLFDHEGWIPPDLRDGAEKFDMQVSAFAVHALLTMPQPQRCATPTIVIAGGDATITCGTAGAVIYYTTDGVTYPSLKNEAQVYGAPVAIASGSTIFAVATLAGADDSDVAGAVAP